MKIRFDLPVAILVAIALHLAALSFMRTTQIADPGSAGGGGISAGAATGDLAALIESWEADPTAQTTSEVLENADADPNLDAPDQPQDQTTDTTQTDLPDPTQPIDELPDVTEVQTPDAATPLDQITPTEIPPQEAPAVKPPDLEVARLSPPDTPAPPVQTEVAEVQPRADQPEPDPNQAPPLPTEMLQMPTANAPVQPIQRTPETTPTQPQMAALPSPQAPAAPTTQPFEVPTEVVPEGPAPLVASVPKKKPKPPAQPVQQTRKKKKPTAQARATQTTQTRQTTQRKPDKPAAPAAPAASSQATTQSQQGGASQGTQTAAVNSGGGTANTDSGFSAAARKQAQSAYMSAVRRAIMKKRRYPRKAKRRGITGKPVLRLSLDASGRLLGVSLAKSSGSSVLDNAAIAAAKAARYPRIPKEMDRSKVTARIGMTFKLN